MTRNCDICKGEFDTSVHNRLRCSPACVRVYRSRWMKNQRVKAPLRNAPCKVCSALVVLNPKASESKAVCSEKCRKTLRAERFRRYQAGPKAKVVRDRYLATGKHKIVAKRHMAKVGYKPKTEQERISRSLRARLGGVLQGRCKKGSTTSYLGCTPTELKDWLTKHFQPGMSWDNYGPTGWHIDHKRPLASFCFVGPDGTINEKEIHAAMHYSNLQPLWYWQNIAKGASFIAV